MILNLKDLNVDVEYHHFKVDTVKSVIKMMKPNCFMASIDIKDAYYTVPIAESDQKFLKFQWRGKIYKFVCFPNGLSICPRKFTKFLKPLYANLRAQGHESLGYIDDSYLQGDSYSECTSNVIDTVSILDKVGFVTHPEKSVFIPTQVLTFRGFLLNSVTMTVRLTPEQAAKIRDACLELKSSNNKGTTIREVARVIGLLTSSFPGVQFGPLHYRHIEWDKTESLKSSKGDFDRKMKLSPPSINELNWWISNIQHSYSNISHGKPDASMTGWGDISCSGFWTPAEASNHINYLELRAIYLVLQSLQSKVTKKHVKLMVDNTTAVSCIMNMGTSRSKQCNHITFEIWEWCICHSVWLSIAHIPGVANVLADKASRLDTYHTEWMLSRKIFAKSIAKLGVTPQIDLFASRLNYQLEPYISYQPDPGALAVLTLKLKH